MWLTCSLSGEQSQAGRQADRQTHNQSGGTRSGGGIGGYSRCEGDYNSVNGMEWNFPMFITELTVVVLNNKY